MVAHISVYAGTEDNEEAAVSADHTRDQADLAVLRRLVVGLEMDLEAELAPYRARQRVVGARTMAAVIAGRNRETSVVGSEWYVTLDHVDRLCNEVNRSVQR